MKNILRETIESVLGQYNIDYVWDVADKLEMAISDKILRHDIDYYTEKIKITTTPQGSKEE